MKARTGVALLFVACALPVCGGSAYAQDDRYPSYDNRMLGKPWVSVAAEQANRRKVHPPASWRGKRTIWQGFRAEIDKATVLGGRPAGCPARAWCGCWLSAHLGLHRRDLWLARNWARVGSPADRRVGTIAVWRHHVGKVTAVAGGKIRVLSGNDGRRVRERWRSARGVIAYRAL